jgi:phage/plasmid-like protein (TIGR03299 family)
MSQETSQWLNQNTLVGFTDKRGTAWHYRASDQGAEPNHYPLAIPVADVERRLFSWHFAEGDLSSTVLLPDGVATIKDASRKTIVRPPKAFGPEDEGAILGVFKQGYQIHQYDEWLLEQVAFLLDADLAISSAGLLRDGAVAWVEISVPDTIVLPSGVAFRPNLLAATSVDGSLSTTYKRTVTNTVCDNTMAAALREGSATIKVKHSRYSTLKLADAREALEIVHSTADDFAAEVDKLTNTPVSDGQFAEFVNRVAPLPEKDPEGKGKRGMTLAVNKRAALDNLWNFDQRVAPWKNTAWGVVQAMNTGEHHVFNVRGMERAERNMLKAVTGGFDKLDAETRNVLAEVLAA